VAESERQGKLENIKIAVTKVGSPDSPKLEGMRPMGSKWWLRLCWRTVMVAVLVAVSEV